MDRNFRKVKFSGWLLLCLVAGRLHSWAEPPQLIQGEVELASDHSFEVETSSDPEPQTEIGPFLRSSLHSTVKACGLDNVIVRRSERSDCVTHRVISRRPHKSGGAMVSTEVLVIYLPPGVSRNDEQLSRLVASRGVQILSKSRLEVSSVEWATVLGSSLEVTEPLASLRTPDGSLGQSMSLSGQIDARGLADGLAKHSSVRSEDSGVPPFPAQEVSVTGPGIAPDGDDESLEEPGGRVSPPEKRKGFFALIFPASKEGRSTSLESSKTRLNDDFVPSPASDSFVDTFESGGGDQVPRDTSDAAFGGAVLLASAGFDDNTVGAAGIRREPNEHDSGSFPPPDSQLPEWLKSESLAPEKPKLFAGLFNSSAAGSSSKQKTKFTDWSTRSDSRKRSRERGLAERRSGLTEQRQRALENSAPTIEELNRGEDLLAFLDDPSGELSSLPPLDWDRDVYSDHDSLSQRREWVEPSSKILKTPGSGVPLLPEAPQLSILSSSDQMKEVEKLIGMDASQAIDLSTGEVEFLELAPVLH